MISRFTRTFLGSLILAILMGFGIIYYWHNTNLHSPSVELLDVDAPKSFVGDFLAGQYALKEEMLAESANLLTSSYETAPELDELLSQAFQLKWLSGQMQDAQALAEKMITKDPRALAPRILVASINLHLQQYDKALDVLAPVLPAPNKIANIHQLVVYLLNVWSYVGLHQDDKAEQMIKSLESTGVFTLPLDYYLGLIDDVQGRLPEAVKRYQSLLQADVISYRITEVAANAFERHGNTDLAIELFQLFSRKGASDNFSVNREIKELQKGFVKRQNPVLTSPADAMSAMLLEVISALHNKGLYHEAMAYSHIVNMLTPKHLEPLLMMGLIYKEQDMCAKALPYFEKIPEFSGYYYASAINRARCLIEQHEDFEANKLLMSLTVRYPEFASPHLVMGDFFFDKKEYEKSINNYERALSALDDSIPLEQRWPIQYAMAFAYEKSNNWEKAYQILTELKKQLPNEPEILNFLGYGLITRDQKVDEAYEMIAKALKIRPNDAHILDSMAWALYTLKKYPEALDYIQMAVDANPDDPTLLDHLANIYYSLGRKREALFMWRQALVAKPEKEDEQRIQASLSKPDIVELIDQGS